MLIEAMKAMDTKDDLRKKKMQMATTFQANRQIGEAEAYYKLLPQLNLTYSSVATTWIPTTKKEDRRPFSQKIDPDNNNLAKNQYFQIKDKEGFFIEKADAVSKYVRREAVREEDIEAVERLTYCQFMKMYGTMSNEPDDVREGELDEEDPLVLEEEYPLVQPTRTSGALESSMFLYTSFVSFPVP